MFAIFRSPLIFVLAFIIYLASDVIKSKLWAKVCRYIAIGLLVIITVVWMNSFNEKVIAGRIVSQEMRMISITHHVEKLLKKGDYKKAEMILNRFNNEFEYYPHNNENLELLIKSMSIPLRELDILEAELNKRVEPTDNKTSTF